MALGHSDTNHPPRPMELPLASLLCKHSYSPSAQAIAGYQALGYQAIDLSSSAGTEEAFLLWRDGAAIVVIRGTDELQDWLIRNLHAVPKPTGDAGLVHAGFYRSAKALQYPIEIALAALSMGQSIKSLDLVGHSKGGATAVLLGGLLKKYAPKVTTMGAPRCGMGGKEIGFEHTRYAHPEDIVPRMPPRTLGYQHTGDCIVIGDGDWAELEKINMVDRIKDFLAGRTSISDHFAYGALADLWPS